MIRDEFFIQRCLELGRLALEKGDAPVGSIIVKDGAIIAEGIEAVKSKLDPTAHAEIEAVRVACEKLNTLDLSECVLYTNAEPCWMCAYAIRQTRISRVCFGSHNEKVGGVNSKFPVFSDDDLKPPVPVLTAGILAEECAALIAEFEERRK